MKKRRIILLGFVTTLVALGLVASTALEAKNDSNITRFASFAKFTKVVDVVEKYYVDDITIDEIIDKALDGLMTNLDAHSAYLEPKAFKDMNIKTSGEFGGLGITVGMRNGALTVVAPIEGTPADKAGMASGDIILKIDDQSTLGMNIDDAVNLMRGKPKTKIRLTVVRKNVDKPLEFTIVRDIIKIQSVYAKRYNGDVLYLRITSFDKNVADGLKEEIEKAKSWTKGIILDLRNNPGGLLDQAVATTDLFVENGIIVSQKGRLSSESREFKASRSGTYGDIPMVVLVNGGSASASEIVSGSLQDHKRAVVVGENTFGKGSVQVILPLDRSQPNEEQEALRLTIARYYLPSGRTIQATGVTPDVIIHPGNALD